MIRKVKHSLDYFVEKSFLKKASKAEETVLENFARTQYDKAKWDTDLMGASDEYQKKSWAVIEDRIGRKKILKLYTKYAFAASIVLLLGLGIYFQKNNSFAPQLCFETTTVSKSIVLSDGSTVYLSPNSILKYPKNFSGEQRNVSLERGNAFFEITKDKQHPFVIKSKDFTTKVLGTSFHICLSKLKSSVLVLTGKVNVSTQKNSVDLTPCQEGIIESNTISKQLVDQKLIQNWYKDMMLNQISLDQLIKLLQYKYEYTFEYAKGVDQNLLLTVFIEKDASLESVLKQMNYITNLKFDVYEKTVRVH